MNLRSPLYVDLWPVPITPVEPPPDHSPADAAQAPGAASTGRVSYLLFVRRLANLGRKLGASLRPLIAFWSPLIAGAVLVLALTAAAFVVRR